MNRYWCAYPFYPIWCGVCAHGIAFLQQLWQQTTHATMLRKLHNLRTIYSADLWNASTWKARNTPPNQTFKRTSGPYNWSHALVLAAQLISCAGAVLSTQITNNTDQEPKSSVWEPKRLSFGNHELRVTCYKMRYIVTYNAQWNKWHALCFVSYVRVMRTHICKPARGSSSTTWTMHYFTRDLAKGRITRACKQSLLAPPEHDSLHSYSDVWTSNDVCCMYGANGIYRFEIIVKMDPSPSQTPLDPKRRANYFKRL